MVGQAGWWEWCRSAASLQLPPVRASRANSRKHPQKRFSPVNARNIITMAGKSIAGVPRALPRLVLPPAIEPGRSMAQEGSGVGARRIDSTYEVAGYSEVTRVVKAPAEERGG